jgi:hypothetical protein
VRVAVLKLAPEEDLAVLDVAKARQMGSLEKVGELYVTEKVYQEWAEAVLAYGKMQREVAEALRRTGQK